MGRPEAVDAVDRPLFATGCCLVHRPAIVFSVRNGAALSARAIVSPSGLHSSAKNCTKLPGPEVLDSLGGPAGAGFCAAATHGVIRVGHAVRSLAGAETPGRVRELADALASLGGCLPRAPGQSHGREQHNDTRARGDRPNSRYSPGEYRRDLGEHYRIARNAG